MNILFPTIHGGITTELAILCQATGNKLIIVTRECGIGHPCQDASEGHVFERWGARSLQNREEFDSVIPSIDAIVVAGLDQSRDLKQFKKPFFYVAGVPGGCADEFNREGIRSLMSPSTRHLSEVHCENKLLYPRLLAKEDYKPLLYPEDKEGFCSFVHWMKRSWPKAHKKLGELNAILGKPIINYGMGTDHGVVPDVEYMRKSKAVLHIKDGGLLCFAVVKAMRCGTVVVMDRESVTKTYAEDVKNVIVRDTIQEVSEELKRLDSDMEYLEEMSFKAYDEACSNFRYTDELGSRFKEFLSRL